MERETPLSNLRYLAGIPIYGKGFGRKGVCLEPGSIQLSSTTSRRFPYLGHLGLTV
jgi:hypothetical protein